MGKTIKHPHSNNPSVESIQQRLTEILHNSEPEIMEIYLAVHQQILQTLPDITFSMDLKDGQMGYGIKQYGYDGWGMAALAAHKKWVNLHFMKGTALAEGNISKVLEGTGKQMRHMKFRTVEDVEEKKNDLQRLLIGASTLHE